MTVLKPMLKLALFPLLLLLILAQWVGIFLTTFSTILTNLLAGLFFLVALASWIMKLADGGEETGKTQEDVEANAFAGLLLMPDQLLSNQIDLFGIDKDDMDTDSVLSLMDMFAIPYKATVLRLYESNCIKRHKAEELFRVTAEDVEKG